MKFDFSLSLGSVATMGVFRSIAQLFANGESGFAFSPMSDTSRLFLLSNGSTGNISVDSDPVGRMLDRHTWADGASLAATLAAQPDLLTNGEFTTDLSGWTDFPNGTGAVATWDAGNGGRVALGRIDSANLSRRYQAITTVVGRTYAVVATGSAHGSAMDIGTSAAGVQLASGIAITSNGVPVTVFFVATTTTTYITIRGGTNGQTGYVDSVSWKWLPGNHAIQATTTRRPAWKANIGASSYIQGDGVDDLLQSAFVANGSGFSMALDVEFGAAASKIAMGGGNSTGDKQASIGLDASGFLSVGWGTAVSQGSVDRRSTRATIVVTGDGTGRDVWVDGVKLSFSAPSGAPDGTGGGMALCGFNNNGTPQDWADAKIYNALVINRRLTESEVTGTVGRNFR